MARKSKEKAIAVLREEERLEYISRERLMKDAMMSFQAAQLYLEQFQDYLVDLHKLPSKYDLNLQTGQVYKRKEETNGAVPSE